MTKSVPSTLLINFAVVLILPFTAVASDGSVPYGYEAANGPARWAALSPANSLCDTGKQQSPVNFGHQDASLTAFPVDFSLPSMTSFNITNKKTTVEFTPLADAVNRTRGMTIDGDHFSLKQFHLHTPSEHRVDNVYYDGEIHFIHKSANGKLAVVGQFIIETPVDNPVWTLALQNVPATPGNTVTLNAIFETAGIIEATKNGVFSYSGSLTTPPCTEGVRWFVAKTPLTMSPAQLQSIIKLIGFSARPPMINVNVASSSHGDPNVPPKSPHPREDHQVSPSHNRSNSLLNPRSSHVLPLLALPLLFSLI